MKLEVLNNTNCDDDEYLSAASSVDAEDFYTEFMEEDEEVSGLYFSLPDISLGLDFENQLTEPLFPTKSDRDFLRYYSLDPPSVSGLILIPKHTAERPQIEYISLKDTQTKTPDFSFFGSLDLQILQSCNGLLLCNSQVSKSYYILNLATHHPELLPSSTFTENPSLNLAFDPYTSPYYKVICVQKIENKKPLHQISIYSSETRLWTLSGKPFDAPGDIDFNDGVFCNGAIHWMTRTNKGLYFDVNVELLMNMPKPPLKEGYALVSCEYFGESQGHLYYAVGSPELPFFEIFEMKEDYTGWFFKARIDLEALAASFSVMAHRSMNPHPFFPRYEGDVLSVIQGQDDDEFEVILSVPGEVIVYNHEMKSAKKLCDLRIRPDDRAVWYRVYCSYQVLGNSVP